MKLNYILEGRIKCVHFNYVGHPLVGDDLYEGSHPEIYTQSLQCYKVTFIHPIYNREIEIEIDYKWLQNILQNYNKIWRC